MEAGIRTYIWWKAETLSVGQRQQFVVIQHRVEVFDPLRIDVTIENDPLSLLELSSDVIYDPASMEHR